MGQGSTDSGGATGRVSIFRKLKRIVIGLAAAALVGAGLYYGGLWQGHARLAAQRAEFDRQLQDAQARLQQIQKQLVAAENRARLAQGHALLYRAVVDLDRQNFGTAQSRLQEAADLLAGLEAAADSTGAARLKTLRREIAGTHLDIGTDAKTQQARILSFAARLDILTPRLSVEGPQENKEDM